MNLSLVFPRAASPIRTFRTITRRSGSGAKHRGDMPTRGNGSAGSRRVPTIAIPLAVLLITFVAASAASGPALAAGWSIQSTPPLNGPPQGSLNSVSCTAASACMAVGNYINSSGTGVPVAERRNGTSWTMQAPANPGGSGVLSGVSCTAANACTAVGNYLNSTGTEVTLAERWNGSNWTIQTTPNPAGATRSLLSGVSCTADGTCTAVGSYFLNGSGTGQTLAEQWHGSSWQIETTPTPSGGGGLARVSCSAASACTALGQASGTTVLYRWNGKSWSSQAIAIPAGATSTQLYGLSCSSATACIAVGNFYGSHCNNGQPTCNCFRTPGCTIRAGTLVEQWNGGAWSVQSTLLLGVSSSLRDVSCTATACTAVGNKPGNLTLAEQSNGSSWTVQTTPTPAGGGSFQSVSCTAASACEAVGQGNGATLAENWNGTNWTIQPTPNPPGPATSSLTGVSCTTATACTAVGSSTTASGPQIALAEQWNGTSWTPTPQSPVNPSGAASSSLAAVSCTAATSCTAAGAYATPVGGNPPPDLALAEAWDGTSWTIQTPQSPGSGYNSVLSGVDCPTAMNCIAVGYDYYNQGPQDAALAEQWDGTSWTILPTPTPTGGYVSKLSSVSCATGTSCVAVGTLGLSDPIAEQWNGSTWTIEPTPAGGPLFGISCPSANACIGVGGLGTPAADSWNGTAWTSQTVPLPAGNNGGQLSSVSCTSASDCTAVGYWTVSTGPDLTLAEHWDGNAWTIEPTPSPTDGVVSLLTSVSCTTATTCTAIGAYQNQANRITTLAEQYSG